MHIEAVFCSGEIANISYCVRGCVICVFANSNQCRTNTLPLFGVLLTLANSKTDSQKGISQPFLCNMLLKIRRAAFHTFVVQILSIRHIMYAYVFS